MPAVQEIVDAVRDLTFEQYVELRQKLDALDENEWKAQLAASTKEIRATGMTDDEIDQRILRRRYEGRS